MKKAKYLVLLAVAAMLISVMSFPAVGKAMPPVDGNQYAIPQYYPPPVIDGLVDVGVTWPVEAFMNYSMVRDPSQPGGGIKVAEVYMMIDIIEGTGYPYNASNPPAGYGPADEVGYYLYIGIKTLPGYTLDLVDPGCWVLIDWDQDGTVDFQDNNGNSANPSNGYSTEFAYTADGAEWKIPYIDEFNGVCQSPFDILVHHDIVFPDGSSDTATFPGYRPKGPFVSTTICIGEIIEPIPPPPPGEWGIRTIGFWKHQLRCALEIQPNAHQHVPTETLIAYLEYISANSLIPELNAMDSDMTAALALLELRGPHPMYDRAVQQLLAVWLNYVSGNLFATFDLDGDGVNETVSLLWVINQTEASLLDGDPTNDEYWKDVCDALNNSGPE
jgi:hypothetical protein